METSYRMEILLVGSEHISEVHTQRGLWFSQPASESGEAGESMNGFSVF